MCRIADCRDHQGQCELLLIVQYDERCQVAVPAADEGHDPLCHQRRDYQRKHDAVEYLQLPAAVHDSRLDQLIGQCTVDELFVEEHCKAVGDRRDDQRQVIVQQVHRLDLLVKTDDPQLSGKHHRHQDNREQKILTLKVKLGEGVRRHHGKIILDYRDRHRQEQAVHDALRQVDVLGQAHKVLFKVGAGQHIDLRHDIVIVVRGRDDHDEERIKRYCRDDQCKQIDEGSADCFFDPCFPGRNIRSHFALLPLFLVVVAP